MDKAEFRIELSLRAALLGRSALELTRFSHVSLARIQFVEVVRAVKELDDFLKKSEADRG